MKNPKTAAEKLSAAHIQEAGTLLLKLRMTVKGLTLTRLQKKPVIQLQNLQMKTELFQY